jgi:anaerobic ribonucleoside-triphosphate reductase activating protein
MNYADIKKYDIANGLGIRVSLFVSGCNHRCKNCFNQEAWDFSYGKPFTNATMEEIIESLSSSYIAGLSLLGGEPFEHANQIGLIPLLKRMKETYPDKNIWCYTGFTFDEDIMKIMYPKWEETREMLTYIDILVDGLFMEELKNPSLRFKGSSNQRIIRVQESMQTGETILWEEE